MVKRPTAASSSKTNVSDAKALPNQQANAIPQRTYSSDQPIQSKAQDLFNRWPFAARIAETLSGRRDPSSVVVGIYGAWGQGKSSVLAMMEEALDAHGHVVCVRFNPWHFGSDERLLRSFFETLAAALGKSTSTKLEGMGKLLDRYGSILSAASVTVGGMVKLDPGNAAKGVGQALSAVELETLKSRIEKILHDAGRRVVVLIDDIDRLDRHEVQTVFKLVKLSANFDHTSYVLAFDDEMVAGALGEQYGAGNAEAGRAFLEKIVQVPLHLPPADELSLRKLVFEGVDAALAEAQITISEEQGQAFAQHFVDGIGPRLTTPRHANLYVNALAFALPLLKGEVNPVDQMLVEAIRLFYPRVFVAIRDNPEYFVPWEHDTKNKAFKTKAKNILDTAFGGSGNVDADHVRKRLLEVLFPRLQSVFGNVGFGDHFDETSAREQRVCSRNYFGRYFSYAVPRGDVPDAKVVDLVELLNRGDELASAQLFKVLSQGDGIGRLISKLRGYEEHLGADSAMRLAVIVAQHGALLPREQAMILSDLTFGQGAILIVQLLRQVPAGAVREEAARRIVAEAAPLPFALKCFRWIRKRKDTPEDKRLVSDAAEEDLGRLLAGRVRTSANETPLHRTFGTDAPGLYWIWRTFDPNGSVRDYLAHWFGENGAEVDSFLATFVGLAWGMESGLAQKDDFDRRHYDAVAEIVDPALVLASLRARHGARLDNPSFHHSETTPFAERVAQQFSFVHKRVKAESQVPDVGTALEEVTPNDGDE